MGEHFQEDLLNIFLDLHDKLVFTTEIALKDSRFNNISRHDLQILKIIGFDEKRSMGEVAQDLRVTVGTISVAIKRLEKKAYVERERSTKDMRIVYLSLTKKGELALRRYRQLNRVLVRRVLKDTSYENQKVLYSFLSRLNEIMLDNYISYKLKKVNKQKGSEH